MEQDNKIKKDTVNAPAVETFTGDMVQVIEDSQGGLIKKIIQDQEKSEVEKKNLSPESKRNRTFVLLSLILILLAVSLLAFLFFKKNSEIILVPNTPVKLDTIIFTDKVKLETLDGLTNEQVAAVLSKDTNNADIKTGELEGIYGTENGKVVGLRRFLTLLKSNFIPGDPQVVSDNFLMGVVNKGTQSLFVRQGDNFFILLQARSFIDIFSLMRTWESKMFSDLHGLFGMDINPSTNTFLTKNFEDGIVENKNARILYDEVGNIVLMYVFADDQSIIIANNQSVVHEVMLRLASSQIKK